MTLVTCQSMSHVHMLGNIRSTGNGTWVRVTKFRCVSYCHDSLDLRLVIMTLEKTRDSIK